jgi:hypothetical protein
MKFGTFTTLALSISSMALHGGGNGSPESLTAKERDKAPRAFLDGLPPLKMNNFMGKLESKAVRGNLGGDPIRILAPQPKPVAGNLDLVPDLVPDLDLDSATASLPEEPRRHRRDRAQRSGKACAFNGFIVTSQGAAGLVPASIAASPELTPVFGVVNPTGATLVLEVLTGAGSDGKAEPAWTRVVSQANPSTEVRFAGDASWDCPVAKDDAITVFLDRDRKAASYLLKNADGKALQRVEVEAAGDGRFNVEVAPAPGETRKEAWTAE